MDAVWGWHEDAIYMYGLNKILILRMAAIRNGSNIYPYNMGRIDPILNSDNTLVIISANFYQRTVYQSDYIGV